METLFNGRLSIEVSAHGAELCSIFSNGKEYLWQADPAFWKRHSPVLFPIVGSVWENEYRNEDTTYVLTQHGFARDMEFTLISEEKHSRNILSHSVSPSAIASARRRSMSCGK